MTFDQIGIVGMGFVGRHMQALFGSKSVPVDVNASQQDRDRVNACVISFICVPTPALPDGSCDVSAVEDCVQWLRSPYIVIRSTVPPGTTDRLKETTGKRLIFQPEFVGETTQHPFSNPLSVSFLILGGSTSDTSSVAEVYKQYYHSSIRLYFTDAIIAELAKYMDNAFWATVVTFCNEFHSLAAAYGVDYNVLREIWLADPRISRDHTFVFPHSPGFGGKCLPKDLLAIIASARARGYMASFLEAVSANNKRFKGRTEKLEQ